MKKAFLFLFLFLLLVSPVWAQTYYHTWGVDQPFTAEELDWLDGGSGSLVKTLDRLQTAYHGATGNEASYRSQLAVKLRRIHRAAVATGTRSNHHPRLCHSDGLCAKFKPKKERLSVSICKGGK